MSKEQTEKCRYKSRFATDLWISDSQYLAENMVDRIARKEKQELPLRFWEIDRWKRHFMLQLRLANGILKLYSIEAIIKALRSKQGKGIYSLGANWLDPLVKVEQDKIDEQLRKQSEIEPVHETDDSSSVINNETTIRPSFNESKINTLNKLRDL